MRDHGDHGKVDLPKVKRSGTTWELNPGHRIGFPVEYHNTMDLTFHTESQKEA